MHKNIGLISQFFYFYSNFFISQSEYMNLLLCWKISCFAVGLLSCWVKISSAPAKLIETIVSLSIFNFLTYFHYPTISQLNYFLYLHLNLVIIIFKFYHSKSLKNSLIRICVEYISIKICEKQQFEGHVLPQLSARHKTCRECVILLQKTVRKTVLLDLTLYFLKQS